MACFLVGVDEKKKKAYFSLAQLTRVVFFLLSACLLAVNIVGDYRTIGCYYLCIECKYCASNSITIPNIHIIDLPSTSTSSTVSEYTSIYPSTFLAIC